MVTTFPSSCLRRSSSRSTTWLPPQRSTCHAILRRSLDAVTLLTRWTRWHWRAQWNRRDGVIDTYAYSVPCSVPIRCHASVFCHRWRHVPATRSTCPLLPLVHQLLAAATGAPTTSSSLSTVTCSTENTQSVSTLQCRLLTRLSKRRTAARRLTAILWEENPPEFWLTQAV